MATLNFNTIKILKDDSAGTLKTALNKTFYGANSTFGDGDPDGYPNQALDNLGFDIEEFEIKIPQSLGRTFAITTGTKTLTISGASIFASGDVGKLLWDGTTSTNLRLIGKIDTITSGNVVELVENFAGATLATAPGYISDVSDVDHNQSLDYKGNFFILVGVEESDGKPVLPSVAGMQNFAPNIQQGVQQGLNISYVALNRISSTNNKVSPAGDTQIPATITRINGYLGSTQASKYFSTVNDIPFWVAYEINPFGTANKNFDKNTTYSLEIQETLPAWTEGGIVKGIEPYVPYISVTYGKI
jgi:hypothetical protein